MTHSAKLFVIMLALFAAGCRTAQPQMGRTIFPLPERDRTAEPMHEVMVEEVPHGRSVQAAVDMLPHMPRECVAQDGYPMPDCPITPWAPDGIEGPWPHDEYLHDGGDGEVRANLGPEGELRGLELEDTVVLYDTIDGRTLIKPSNRVCLYAPRFAAVRKVTSLIENQQYDQLVSARQGLMPHLNREGQLATAAVQPEQPIGGIGTRRLNIEQTDEGTMPAISRQPIAEIDGGVATYENLAVLRTGMFLEAERARLIEAVDAAITWSHDQAVQVVLDGRAAIDMTSDQRVQETFRIDTPNNPCLRIIKCASTKVARPGDVVDFTIRFDNQGDTELRNVVLIDNLTTRLEYIPGTQACSRGANFDSEANQGESLVLRWELAEPLPIGQGGIVRFHCRVR